MSQQAIAAAGGQPFPELFAADFGSGLGYWGSSAGPSNTTVSGGVFHSTLWSRDDNHIQAYGGVGRVHLLAYADFPYWESQNPDGSYVNCNLTNARVKLTCRGINFVPNGSKFIFWIQARMPNRPDLKYSIWARTGQDFTDKLTSGNWETIEFVVDADPAKWSWAKGVDGYIYDAFYPVAEALKYIHNIIFIMLGPDGVGLPTGAFELSACSVVFNRNDTPTAIVPPPGPVTASWDAAHKASQVTLSNNDLTAVHGAFGPSSGVRGSKGVSTGKWYWENKVTAGTMANTFGSGVVTSAHDPASNGGTFFGQFAYGWSLLTNSGNKRTNGADAAYGSALALNDVLMTAIDLTAGKIWWGKNGVWFASGNPAAGTGFAYNNLSGTIYPCDGNGTSANSFTWTANFGASAFAYAPPAGFVGLGA